MVVNSAVVGYAHVPHEWNPVTFNPIHGANHDVVTFIFLVPIERHGADNPRTKRNDDYRAVVKTLPLVEILRLPVAYSQQHTRIRAIAVPGARSKRESVCPQLAFADVFSALSSYPEISENLNESTSIDVA
jgi:hypothetical protein